MRPSKNIFFYFALLLGLMLVFQFSNPFGQIVVSKSFSIQHLSAAQRNNLIVASQRVNGNIMKAGQSFSFNQLVGPRTAERGFQEAASYLDSANQKTAGGGICLLSSGLYQLALLLNLPIQERVAHSMTVSSVEPGLDATVWYGQADLKFLNNTDSALQFKVKVQGSKLFLEARSRHKFKLAKLLRKVQKVQQELEVAVYKEVGSKRELVSRDLYRLAMR